LRDCLFEAKAWDDRTHSCSAMLEYVYHIGCCPSESLIIVTHFFSGYNSTALIRDQLHHVSDHLQAPAGTIQPWRTITTCLTPVLAIWPPEQQLPKHKHSWTIIFASSPTPRSQATIVIQSDSDTVTKLQDAATVPLFHGPKYTKRKYEPTSPPLYGSAVERIAVVSKELVAFYDGRGLVAPSSIKLLDD
jgi:hypothetical protein